MSAPTRFLALAVFSWIGIRATAGMLDLGPLPSIPLPSPAASLRQLAEAEPLPPMLPAGAPIPGDYYAGHAADSGYAYGYPAGYPALHGDLPPTPPRYAAAPAYYPYPVYPAAMPRAPQSAPLWLDSSAALDFNGVPPPEDSPLSRLAAGAPRTAGPIPSFTGKQRPGLDRLSLSSWAFVRQERPQVIDLRNPTAPTGEAPLATGGTLGGSQAGARLTWRWSRALAMNLRVSAPLRQGQRRIAGEAALGLSWQPLRSVPVRLMAERRKAVGAPGGGRDAFALLAEGGVYERPLPWQLRLDGYAQTGVVGARSRDWFVDGGATVTRPIYGRFALGAGLWGGAQPGLSRLDIGPRMSMQVRPGIRAYVDYRHRLFGTAEPGSGFAATVATDF